MLGPGPSQSCFHTVGEMNSGDLSGRQMRTKLLAFGTSLHRYVCCHEAT